jgi:hypothetical protein
MNYHIDPELQTQIYIVVDDLRVGGVQRLALDEAYALVDQKRRVTIISLNDQRVGDSILKIDGTDRGKLRNLGINVIYLPGKKYFSKIKEIVNVIKKNEINSVVCHSVTAIVMFRAASFIALRRLTLNLWIHQLITLSAPVQRTKRLLYSILASRIFFSSHQFKLEWESQMLDKIIRLLLFKSDSKRIVSRLGVYVPRVLNEGMKINCSASNSHLIFASRLSAWKGVNTFLSISKSTADSHSVLMSVNLESISKLHQFGKNSQTEHLIDCKPPSFVSNVSKPVHIYPTDYGPNSSNPQAIGLNVIEFACIGIPSLVSREGFTTYPELYDAGLVLAVDWNNQFDVQLSLDHLKSLTQKERQKKAALVRKFCSIDEHVSVLVAFA